MKRKGTRFYIPPRSKKKAKASKLVKDEEAVHGAAGLPTEGEQTAPLVVECSSPPKTRGNGRGKVQTEGEICVRGAEEEHVRDAVGRLILNSSGENPDLGKLNSSLLEGMTRIQEAWIGLVKAQVEAEKLKKEVEDKVNEAKGKYIGAMEDMIRTTSAPLKRSG